MSNAPVKAIAISDRRASSWFSEEIVDDESVECQLLDVEDFLSDIERLDSALQRRKKDKLDVVMLDSALPPAFLVNMAIRVRDKAPGVPILMLPQVNTEDGSIKSSSDAATETITKVIRHARNRQRLQSKLLQLAFKDDLTGLHNRRGFQALAKQQLRLAHDMKRRLLMFFADVDDLKQINDQFGHHEGDRALLRTATSFKNAFRKSDVTARLGGDEFIALMLEEPERNAETISRRLQLNLTRCAVKEPRYRLSLSVGVARFDPQAASSLQDLMAQADKALYAQKRKRVFLAQTGSRITLVGCEATAATG